MAQGRARAALRAGRPPLRSPGRPPVNQKRQRQEFWRRVAEGLTSEDAATACGVSPVLGTRWFRESGGMPLISLDPPSGRYLSFEEREEIAVLRAQECGVREVARRLGRSPSTVSRELRRNAATRAGVWTTGPRSRSGTPTGRPAAPERPSWSATSGFRSTCRTDSPARSPPRTAAWSRDRRRGGSGDGMVRARTDAGRHPGARSRSPAASRSISPMMSRCASPTRRSTRPSTSRGAEG